MWMVVLHGMSCEPAGWPTSSSTSTTVGNVYGVDVQDSGTGGTAAPPELAVLATLTAR